MTVSREPDPYLALADEAALRAAVASRLEERDRRDRAAELATWIGTLRDLAERGVRVSIACTSGRTHRGVLVAVALDHVGVELDSGSVVLLALDTLRAVRPEPGQPAPAAMGDRDERPADRTLAEVLTDLAERDGEVAIVLRDVTEPLQGEVLGLGEDVLTLRTSGSGRDTVYVPLAAVSELLVL